MNRIDFKAFLSICIVISMLLYLIAMDKSLFAPIEAVAASTSPTSASNAAFASPSSLAPAAPIKNGYTLVPMKYGKTGVDTSSPFILTAPEGVTAEKLIDTLSIDGQPAPNVKRSGAGKFVVTPSMTLSPNSLYIFRLKQGGGAADITWAFQTVKKFMITSCHPGAHATNVPVNGGIEITFSDEGYSDLKDNFVINPSVGGRFERHKNTAVFIPAKALEYKTVYTVTVKAGLGLSDTGERLADDYAFSFETEPPPGYEPAENNEYLNFYAGGYFEWPSTDNIRLFFLCGYHNRIDRPLPALNTDVYKFASVEQAAEAVIKLKSELYWLRYSMADYLTDVSNLTKVTSFKTVVQKNEYPGRMEFPDKLPQGFYLLDVSFGSAREQLVAQVTDLAVQTIADDAKTLLWVNDIGTGKPAAGATVTIVNHRNPNVARTDVANADVANSDVTGANFAGANFAGVGADGGKTYKADEYGVCTIDGALSYDRSVRLDIASNGKKCVWFYLQSAINPLYYYAGYSGPSDYRGHGNVRDRYGPDSEYAGEAYWTTLHLERSLYKRDDSVYFFGFAKNRTKDESIKNVTATITDGYRYGYYGNRNILHKQAVPVKNNAYDGELKLPNLDAGSYCLTISHGETPLGRAYFEVRDYTKPTYTIEVTADRQAAFADETVAFTAKAGFFEGTPVSGLDVSYNLWGYNLVTPNGAQGITDIDGKVAVSYKIAPQADAQGRTSLNFIAEATLPEIGLTQTSADVRVFINDVDVKAEAKRSAGNATLTVDVNSITLDRINGGTAKGYDDYLDAPIAGKPISVDISRVYSVKIPDGDYYDFIEKKNVQKYRYERLEERIASFEMLTDAKGRAEKKFTVPDRDGESYYANVSCVDGKGRKLTETAYIGKDYSNFYWNVNSIDYYLDGVKEAYAIGESVDLTIMRGMEKVAKGGFLFVGMQRGIKGYSVGKNPYSFVFAKEHIPNLTVYAYYFDGVKYISGYRMNADIRYDSSQNELTLTAATDKESYKPGDICNVTVIAKDKDGVAKEAHVSIGVVDEALYSLADYSVNTLISLYAGIGDGLRISTATHGTYASAPEKEMNNLMYATADEGGMMYMMAAMAGDGGGPGAEEPYLRELFKDTAFFGAARTNAQGEAAFTFKLPDNITSWRLTASGVSDDLYAGNGVINIAVTNPMFINYALNDEFLIGDVPAVGVSAYGSSLAGGETVNFEVWDENAPDKKYTARGAAFERVNIPLWKLKDEGAYALIIKATVDGPGAGGLGGSGGSAGGSGGSGGIGANAGGLGDAVKHEYTVHKTYRQIDAAEYYDATPGTKFAVGESGVASITFTDRGRGQFLHQLLNLRYVYGDRVESHVASREANKLIAEYFPDLKFPDGSDAFDVRRYQRDDGGISILPHADSDLATTVKVMPFVRIETNINALKNYLYEIYEGNNAENKMCALYGLAMLREPVLLDLNNYALLEGLSVKDAVYIALGYCALGETEAAAALYDAKVAPRLTRKDPYYFVDYGADKDDLLEATSAAAELAVKLDKPEKESLYRYCIDNYTTDILINIEKLIYIANEIARKSASGGSITYSLYGEEHKHDFANGASHTIRIPAQNIGKFKLLETVGDIGAVSTYKKLMTDVNSIDNDITVRRRYYKANDFANSRYTFEQGDLVRVQLWIDYSAKSIDGSYCVTDYLPSGLEYVENSAKIDGANGFGYEYGYGYHSRYCSVEGQKVSFYDYNGKFNKGYLYYYYARVISPGSYKAEGTLVQNLAAKGNVSIGEDDILKVLSQK